MTRTIAVAVFAVLTLAGCGQAEPDAQPPAAMAAEAKSASGTGTVTAVDAAAGTVTLDHQPIPAIGWPAMTMTFKAPPELLTGIGAGDRVTFDLAVENNTGRITALARQ